MLTKEQLVRKYGTDVLDLNNEQKLALGCGRRKGETKKLRSIWSKVLNLKPRQDAVRMKYTDLKVPIITRRYEGHSNDDLKSSSKTTCSESEELDKMRSRVTKINWQNEFNKAKYLSK